MTPKQIVYGEHAVSRMQLRGITRQDVRGLLAVGIQSREPTREGARPRFGRRAEIEGREAMVVYMEDAKKVEVVTVYWTDEKKEDYR